MTDQQIRTLIESDQLLGHRGCHDIKETHISWVILCRDYVYKIKKPVKFSFLDFSSLEKRKYFCQQEVILNQRLTTDIYLKVVPVYQQGNIYTLSTGGGQIVDYAVLMRRQDNTREMNKVIEQGEITKSDIKKIARQLVDFHKKTKTIKGKLSANLLIDDFNDIKQIEAFVNANLGQNARDQFLHVIAFVENFVQQKSDLINMRDREGFTKDCHGDLHSGNIFILDEPVIFDCIEFNEHFRQVDILNELAFFCMDLEYYHRQDLSDYFINVYTSHYPLMRNKEERELFLFYKVYRANVKTKINAIKVMQAKDPEEAQNRMNLFKKYFQLYIHYFRQIENFVNLSSEAV